MSQIAKEELPKVSILQCYLRFVCRLLSGDYHEEKAIGLYGKISPLRKRLYFFFHRISYKEGMRLYRKYQTHSFRNRPIGELLDKLSIKIL